MATQVFIVSRGSRRRRHRLLGCDSPRGLCSVLTADGDSLTSCRGWRHCFTPFSSETVLKSDPLHFIVAYGTLLFGSNEGFTPLSLSSSRKTIILGWKHFFSFAYSCRLRRSRRYKFEMSSPSSIQTGATAISFFFKCNCHFSTSRRC